MAQYLLSMFQPVGQIPDPEFLAPVMKGLGEVNQAMVDAGEFVFTSGLAQPDTATTVRFDEGEHLLTDGPFIEVKEFLGGLWIVDCPDLDAALGWAKRIQAVTTLPLEVRPMATPG